MPGASSGGYLPPVVATLIGEDADVLAKIAAVKAALEDLSKTPTDVTITADGAQALAVARATRAAMNAMALPPITFTIAINDAQALAELAVIRAIASMAPITIPVDADITAAVAKMAVLKTVAEKQGGGFGVLGRLLYGTTGVFGLAAFGTILDFAGLGFLRLATTVLALAGSLAGALAGGALLAAGSLGVMAAGMGSDMLVMRSALTNTTNIAKAQTAYNLAVAQYGPNSAQAVTALGNYKFAISQLPVAMQASTVALATMLNNTKAQWQQATAVAQVAAQGIMTQVLLVAQTYIPLIAAAATKNFALISAGLKPLFDWLKSPAGIGVFKTLEGYFAANLPNAMRAFTQGVELVLKTLQYLASFTGGLTKAIADFLTKLNTPAGFATFEGYINTAIGMFHTWWDLIKEVAKVLYDLFRQGVGTGTTLVQTITQMLTQLDNWLRSTSGSAQVKSLFQVHLQEILAILAIIPQVIGTFGQLYLLIAPPLVTLVTGIATFVGWLLKIPVVGPIVAWGIAIAILADKMNLVKIATWLFGGGLTSLIGTFAGVIVKIWLAVAAAAAWIASAAQSAAAWVVSAAKTIATFVATAAAYVVNSVKMFAELVAKSAARASIWLAEQAKAIASFVATAVGYAVNSAKMLAELVIKTAARLVLWMAEKVKAIASFVATTVSYVLNQALMSNSLVAKSAARVVLWLAEKVKAIASFVATAAGYAVQSAVMLAKLVATAATMTATWIATQVKAIASFVATALGFGVQTTAMAASAARASTAVSLSFLAMLGPIALVTAAIAGVALAIWGVVVATQHMNFSGSSAVPGSGGGGRGTFRPGMLPGHPVPPGYGYPTPPAPPPTATHPGHLAAGGAIAAGQWGTVGEASKEGAFARLGGGVDIYPMSGARSGGVGGGNMNMTNHVQITVQGGTTNAATGLAVEQAVYKAMQNVHRQLRGGARTYGFMPS